MFNRKLFDSLLFKISFRVILVEILILTIVGTLYINRFFAEIDQRLEDSVELPSQLVESGLVRLVSLSDTNALRSLVGDEVQELILSNSRGQILYSLHPEYRQLDVYNISFLESNWFSEQNPGSITEWSSNETGNIIYNVSRFSGIMQDEFYLYVQSDTSTVELQKRNILIVFFLGSLATFISTLAIVVLFFQRTVFGRLNATINTLQNVEQGDLRARIENINSHDEIARLQTSVNNMIHRLQSVFATLEQRIEDRTQEAEEARQQAEQANEAKSIFLSNMSHELRTPLNTVIAFSSSMLTVPDMYNGKSLDPIFAKDVKTIWMNGQYLLGLINDILDLSKIEAGKLTLNRRAVDLVDTFNGVFSTAVGLLQDKPIQLKPEYPDKLPPIWADPLRIRQILLNLMSNGVKYTESGSVTLAANIENNRLVISVADTGAGIPESMLDSIFDRFTQVKMEHQTKGTGLGLDISQRLCQMHDSKLEIRSVEGEGSTFSFSLPLATDEQINAEEQEINELLEIGSLTEEGILDPTSYYNIVIIARSSSARITIRNIFEEENHNVFESVDIDESVELAGAIIPDFIVVDLGKGDSEMAIVEALKSNEETQNIPIVALGTKDMSEDTQYVMDLYLKKPIHGKRILKQITKLFAEQSLEGLN